MDNIIRWMGALSAVAFGWFGDLPSVVRILLILMVFDIFTGIAQAIIKKNLSSEIAFDGMAKKAVILMVVGLSFVIAGQIVNADFSAPVGQAVAGFYVAVEAISILEKADTLNIPLPPFLRSAINNLKERKDIQSGPA